MSGIKLKLKVQYVVHTWLKKLHHFVHIIFNLSYKHNIEKCRATVMVVDLIWKRILRYFPNLNVIVDHWEKKNSNV